MIPSEVGMEICNTSGGLRAFQFNDEAEAGFLGGFWQRLEIALGAFSSGLAAPAFQYFENLGRDVAFHSFLPAFWSSEGLDHT